MQTLDGTILNALPAIAADFHEKPVTNAGGDYQLYADRCHALIPASGWLADRFGTRNVFLFSIVLFAAGSLFCAESTSLSQMVIARIIQGIGGCLNGAGRTIGHTQVFPKEGIPARCRWW